jgi:hypothetical protein
LTLNGTINLGASVYNYGTALYFEGTQTVGGNGSVVFGIGFFYPGESNFLYAEGDNASNPATLTIASGITITGGNGTISGSYSARTSGPITYMGDSVVNDGIIDASISGGTITVGSAGSFVNNSTLEATNGGSLSIDSSVPTNGTSILTGYGTGTLTLDDNLTGSTTNAAGYNPLEEVLFNGNGTAASPQLFEAMSDDVGAVAAGYTNNFAYGSIVIGNNNYVQLVDQSHNSTGSGPEAVYCVSVTVPAGSTLDLNGLHLYTGSANVQGTILNGSITLASVPPAVAAVSGNGQAIVDNSTTASAANGTDFGSVLESTGLVDQIYTIANDGIVTLTLGSVSLPTGFTLVDAPPSSILAHSFATFEVGLSTTNPGIFGGDVSFATNDTANNPYSFEITGTVLLAQAIVSVSHNGQPVANGSSNITISEGTNFGTTAEGGAPVSSSFTITNSGNATLVLGTVSVPGGFSLLGTPSATVLAGASTTLTIGLGTTVPGTFAGEVVFSTSDPNNPSYSFEVAGAITAAPAPITSVSYNGVAIGDHSIGTSATTGTNFGNITVGGTAAAHVFSIYNTGNATLTLGTINLPAGFSLIGTPPASNVAPGGSTNFTIGLGTTNAGTFNGNVSFSTNDTNNNPFTFAIAGTVSLAIQQTTIVVTPASNQTALAYQSTSFALGSFTESNGTGPYTADVSWGDGSADTFITNLAPGTIPAQNHTYYTGGTETVTLSVTDSANHTSNSATFIVGVTPVATSIVATPPGNQAATPGLSTLFVLGSFTQTFATAPYTVTVNWGDGTAQTSLSVTSAGSIPAVPHTYTSSGNDTATITVTDSVGHTSNSAMFNVNVATTTIALTPPPNQTAIAGQSTVFALGSFTQSNTTGPFVVTVNWGDGGLESIFSVAAAGVIPATAHTFTSGGNNTVTLTVMDSANHTSNSASFGVTISTTQPLDLTSSAFYLKLDADGKHLDVWDGASDTGSPSQWLLLSTVSSITINGVSGGTTLSVDFSAGDPLISSGLNFDGAAGASNTLNVIDTGDANTANFTVDTNDIQIAVSTGTVPLTYTNTAAINIYAGSGAETLTQNAQPANGASLSYLNTTAGDNLAMNAGTFTFAAASPESGVTSVVLGNVAIAAGTNVVVAAPDTHSDRFVLVLDSLFIAGSTNAWQGQLDLTGNDLIVKGGNLSQITNQLANGFNAGAGYWNGSHGIISTAAANDSRFLTSLGVMLNTSGSSFDNQPSSVGDILVKYTYYGDANLDGVVNGADYQQIDSGFGNHATDWSHGNFNYDGVVDGSDFSLIDNTFNQVTAIGAGPLAMSASADITGQSIVARVPTTRNVFNAAPIRIASEVQLTSKVDNLWDDLDSSDDLTDRRRKLQLGSKNQD